MSSAATKVAAAGPGGAGPSAPSASSPSLTECRSVGVVARQDQIDGLANLLRSLCSSYCTHAVHSIVLRLPLPPAPGEPPGGTSTLLRLSRRLPGGGLMGAGGGVARVGPPFLEESLERWEVRHEGPPLQGPALNSLPASMREVTEGAAFGTGALDFWKALGGKLEYEMYREGNEYSIVFLGYEIKVILASVYALSEPHVLRDASSLKRVSGSLLVEASLRVTEGRHMEGANLLGVFGAHLAPYVKMGRAEVTAAAAAAVAAAAGGRRK